MRKFSIVMAFRDTPRERKFAAKSIPSAIRVEPDELIIGVDDPADESFLALIDSLCGESSFRNYKIIKIARTDEWNFRLAHIIWECYNACKNDKIFAFDVDTVIRPTILKGYDMVGRDKNAIVSFTKKLLIQNPGQLIRHVFYRIRVRRNDSVFSGNYWIYRPYYFENVDLDGFKKIHNGIDTYMVDCVQKRATHKMITLKDIGVNSMDLQNEDYPWHQFNAGVWTYANKKELGEMRAQVMRSQNTHMLGNRVNRFINRHPTLFIMIKVLLYQHPWALKGYLWAGKNNNHEAISAAHGKTLSEWSLVGAQYVKDIHDWKKHGRLGTGYA